MLSLQNVCLQIEADSLPHTRTLQRKLHFCSCKKRSQFCRGKISFAPTKLCRFCIEDYFQTQKSRLVLMPWVAFAEANVLRALQFAKPRGSFVFEELICRCKLATGFAVCETKKQFCFAKLICYCKLAMNFVVCETKGQFCLCKVNLSVQTCYGLCCLRNQKAVLSLKS